MKVRYFSLYICIIVFVMFIQKVNAQSLSWAQGFITSSNSDFCQIFKVITDSDNNVFSIGWFRGTVDVDKSPNVYNITAVGSGNMFLLKEDSSGNFIWVKHFVGMSSGSTSLQGRTIGFDVNDNIYIGGFIRDSFDMDPGPNIYNLSTNGAQLGYILKLDSEGNFIWVKTHEVNNPVNNFSFIFGIKIVEDVIYSIVDFGGTIDANPGIGINNFTSTNGIGNDVLLVKMDTAGIFYWAKQIGSTGIDHFSAITSDSNFNLYVTGSFQNTVDFDPGTSNNSLTSVGDQDIFVAKYDSSGNYVWAKNVGGINWDIAQDISIDLNKNILITGFFEGTVDFNPGASVYNLTSTSTRSGYNLKLRNNGDFVWVKKFGGSVGLFGGNAILTDDSGNVYTVANASNYCILQKLDSSGNFIWSVNWQGDGSYAMAKDNGENIYISGVFSGINKDFDPGPGTFLLSGSTQGSGYILKLNTELVNVIDDLTANFECLVIPNPTCGQVQISTNSTIDQITITDVYGQCVLIKAINQNSTTLDLSDKYAGVYFYQIKKDKKIVVGKLIITK